MSPIGIVLIVCGAVLLLLFLLSFALLCAACLHCRRMVENTERFLSRPAYRGVREQILSGRAWADAQESHLMTVRSFDGLTLAARFFPCENARGTVLLFHGWRSEGSIDFSCGMRAYRELGMNLLLVDQRAQGKSGGRFMTFGVRERRDVATWVRAVNEMLGADKPVFLVGLSMGATTVLMAAGEPLAPNVCGILADCGFTSPEAIIAKVAREAHLPPKLVLPLLNFQTKLFAGFALDEYSTVEAMKRCTLPVLFAHGEKDGFVPCEMSKENFAACASKDKTLLLVPNAGHGKSYLLAREEYEAKLAAFFDRAIAEFERKKEKMQ